MCMPHNICYLFICPSVCTIIGGCRSTWSTWTSWCEWAWVQVKRLRSSATILLRRGRRPHSDQCQCRPYKWPMIFICYRLYIISSCNIHMLSLQVPSDFDHEAVYVAIAEELERLLSPLGTRDNPAASCLDIASCRGEQFTTGVWLALIQITWHNFTIIPSLDLLHMIRLLLDWSKWRLTEGCHWSVL